MPLPTRHPLRTLLLAVFRVALSCLLWMQAGLAQTVAEALEHGCGCTAPCPSDDGDDDERCPPGCDDCVCCPNALPAAAHTLEFEQIIPQQPPETRIASSTERPTSHRLDRIWRPPRKVA